MPKRGPKKKYLRLGDGCVGKHTRIGKCEWSKESINKLKDGHNDVDPGSH